MKILITGGCGFIGVNLISYLKDKYSDIKIRVLDNLTVGKKDDLERIADVKEVQPDQIKDTVNDKIELVVGDIRDGPLAFTAGRDIDVIVHLAANTGVIPSIQDPGADCMINVIGTFNYLDSARKNGIKRFIFASSGAPLGEKSPPVHEEMAPKPLSPYGASKLAGEGYCSAYHGSYGIETVALRFGNVYGQNSYHKESVVAKFIKHILSGDALTIFGDGNQTRDFIYVKDLARAISLAIKKKGIGGEVFQIATHKEHTVLEITEELNILAQKYLGRKGEIIFKDEQKGEVRRNYSDIRKAIQMLGFEPEYDLAKGLEETFLWFLRNQGSG